MSARRADRAGLPPRPGLLLLVLPLLMLLLILGGCGSGSSGGPRVLVFGDSLASGSGMADEERGSVWVRQVQRRAGEAFEIVNESRGGRWTKALDEFEAVLRRHRSVDLLVLALGTNDSGDVRPSAVEQATANLRGMIAQARAAWGAELRVLVVGPPTMNGARLLRTRHIAVERIATLAALNAAFEQLAAETDSRFLSLFDVVPESTMTSDGMHPDAEGNGHMTEAAYPAIVAALSRGEQGT